MPMSWQWNKGRLCYYVCGGQTLDKERDIKDVRSDTRVINSGPVQTQPIKGVLQHLTMGGCYLLFVQVLVVHVKCKSHSSPIWSRHWHRRKIPPSTSIPFPLLIVVPLVRPGSSNASILTCLGWCNVQPPIHKGPFRPFIGIMAHLVMSDLRI